MPQSSYQVSDSLYLVRQTVAKKKPAKPVSIPTNWIVTIDCSGSMSWDLPKIRGQLKKKLPKLLGKDDVISIIWFSGRNQCGVLVEAEPVATLADLSTLNQAIDRWLRPVGLTGFKEPIQEAAKVASRGTLMRSGSVNAHLFMSDGWDNQWSRAEVLREVEKAAGSIQSTTIVEYGYYADRNMLSSMAEKSGGAYIFAEDFDKYSPQFESFLQRQVSGAPRVEVGISGDPIGGFVFTLADDDLITYSVEEGTANVPEDTVAVFYLSPTTVGSEKTYRQVGDEGVLYAAISLFAVRMQPNVVLPLLKATGDVRYIDQFSGCFGKQKYSEFMEATKAAAFDKRLRFTEGHDPDRVPREDSYTVLELLQLLASDDKNRMLLEHPGFKYNRIGRGRIDSSALLTDEDQAEIAKLTEEMGKTRDAKKLKELSAKIASISDAKQKPLKFDADSAPDGYPVDALVFNEQRPNISVRVKREGVVDLSDRLTPEVKDKIPTKFRTHKYNNYTIIKDGLVNVEVLPVTVSASTLLTLDAAISEGRAPKDLLKDEDGVLLLNLKNLPVINRQMVQSASAEELFRIQWDLIRNKAAQRVYNDYCNAIAGRPSSKRLKEEYGEESATWLKEQGITDNGFSPKSVQAESTDFYMGKEMAVKVKSFSSLPSVKDVKGKIAKKAKLNPAALVMEPAIMECERQVISSKEKFSKWVEKKAKETTWETRHLLGEKAKLLFAVVVGQTWFKEFSSLDENTMTLSLDGLDREFTVEMKEVEVKI